MLETPNTPALALLGASQKSETDIRELGHFPYLNEVSSSFSQVYFPI